LLKEGPGNLTNKVGADTLVTGEGKGKGKVVPVL
jgi:hypothetical protein